MMHLHLWAIVLLVAVSIRFLGHTLSARAIQRQPSAGPQLPKENWQQRWHCALLTFVVPPLLLLTTAIAVLAMGYSTAHPWDGQLSYAIALMFSVALATIAAHLLWTAFKTWKEVRRCPRRFINIGPRTAFRQQRARMLEVPAVFSAQVGLWPSLLWSSELVLSQGLLTHLDDEHLDAVLAHEAGHDYYRDTFWFFWMGGLRRLTLWLPYSESLWQELLLLREIRADHWAAKQVDSLVLAESLMSVITSPLMNPSVCASFSCAAPRSRLAQRIEALLCIEASDGESAKNAESAFRLLPWQWGAIAFALTPLLTIPAHY